MKYAIPDGYVSCLSVYDTQKAISLLKRLFEDRLGALLNLQRVSAPLFVDEASGLNDNLNGYERPVSFDILRSPHRAEIVQSLAKWKRLALKRYGFYPGKGIVADMDAVRRDEDELDALHLVYVDQWDWEKVILPENRNLDYLKSTVMDIVTAICDTQETMQAIYPQLQALGRLSRRVSFITAPNSRIFVLNWTATPCASSIGDRSIRFPRRRRGGLAWRDPPTSTSTRAHASTGCRPVDSTGASWP